MFSIKREQNKTIIKIAFIKIKISGVQKFFIKVLKPILPFLDYIIPKDNHKIVFLLYPKQENKTYAYSDYIEKFHKEYKCSFITREKNKVFKRHTEFIYTFNALYKMWSSKYIVIANDQFMLEFFKSSKHGYINLWHGMPIKSLGLTDNNPPEVKKRYRFIGQSFKTFATSDIFKQIMMSCFNAPKENVYVTGLPVTDVAMSKEPVPVLEKLFKFSKYDKVIFYAPTFKSNALFFDRQIDHEYTNLFYFDDYNEESFINFLEKNNILFIMKPHPLDEKFYFYEQKETLPKTPNFKIIYDGTLTKNDFCLYELFRYADLMISDFSSITIDFLILDRPVIYLDNLTEEYSQNRGLILPDNYNIFMPGYKVKTYTELENSMKTALYQDNTKDLRHKQLPLIHKYQDDKASERIFNIMTNTHNSRIY